MIEINVENFLTIAIVAIIVAWAWDKWIKNWVAKTPLGV